MLTTKTKVAIARVLNRVILGCRKLLGLPQQVRPKRKDLTGQRDLNEAIDLAIYLGRYQRLPRRVLNECVRAESLVIDIGANIGAHALPLAQLLGANGRIIAVEPTRFAF